MRLKYFLLTILTMFLGLISRKYMSYLPQLISPYLGDILWATMVYFGFKFLFPKSTKIKGILLAIVFSYSIEFSQLYQATWINNLRSTTLGALVLGHGFLFSDLVCYTIGILFGFIFDFKIIKLKKA